MLKRRFDKMLTYGTGSQLLLLLFTVVVFFGLFLIISLIFGWNYGWQDIIAMFLDPGGFGGRGEHDGFRLIVTLVGILLFSTLLISVVNNIFDNISDSAKNGLIRYRVKGHVLILGASHHLLTMLEALHEKSAKQDIVVMTVDDVESLRAKVDARFSDSRFMNRIVFYRGAWDSLEELKTARPQFADTIYVIGEANSTDHDSMNMRCCNLLKSICTEAKHDIYCYVMMESGSTLDMYMKEKKSLSTERLKIDVVNAREYAAEQVLVGKRFLPVIKTDDPRHSHFVILGIGDMTKAVAFTVAHNSHYPRINGMIRKTRITIIGKGMRSWMENLAASRPGLFELSHITYINPEGKETQHVPETDFLDIEWEFIDMGDTSPQVREWLKQWAKDPRQVMNIAICHADQSERIASLIHLPTIIYDKEHPTPICIYLEEGGETALRAMQTGEYGIVQPFGPAMGSTSDPLFIYRSERGIHINAIYLVGSERLTEFDPRKAWYEGSESDKFASTYCANALTLRWDNFDMSGEREPLYEAEHRRWMTTKLLMNLEHEGIVPYDKVPQWKKDNFKNIIDWTIEDYNTRKD